MVIKIGIDDAGRGPVIGPMVLAGVLCDSKKEGDLKELGVKDSKQLTSNKREEIVKEIKKNYSFYFEIIEAKEIDAKTKAGINLNRIEAIAAARIVNNLVKNFGMEKGKIEVIIDCPSPNCENWKAIVERYLDEEIKKKVLIKAEHKADANHPCCSAASIVAKTTRDSEIEILKKELGSDFGSGYASDEKTLLYVKENFNLLKEKGLVRECWDTCKRIKGEIEQKKLF
jgi:ribonuclease HII